MAHELSETTQYLLGQWINIHGKKTPRAGQPLPAIYPWETEGQTWPTMQEAEAAAKQRSQNNDTLGLRIAEPPQNSPQSGLWNLIVRMLMSQERGFDSKGP